MIICLDSGNSRVKWGAHDGQRWLAQGAVAQSDLAELGRLVADYPMPDKVMLANVAGAAAAVHIRQQLARWSPVLCEVKSAASGAGVRNLYQHPERLGVDRWCALIGARRLIRSACVVVMAGTATTIDTLDADGQFLGGMILPGIELMRRSLASDTADLPFADGHYVAYPRCTDDAIVTGTLEAHLGAIERAFARISSGPGQCLLSGGNADVLAEQLVIPHQLAQNLPLEGLRQLALDS